MVIKTIMVLFVILGVAAMMGISSITSAYAAQKIVDTNSIVIIDDIFFECGQVINFDGALVSHQTIWDNNNYNFKARFLVEMTDASGNHVGNAKRTTSGNGTFGDEPIITQFNTITTCDGDGVTTSFHYGMTLHKDGTVTVHKMATPL